MHATPPAPCFKHANIFGYIKYIGPPPLFLKPGSAPEEAHFPVWLWESEMWNRRVWSIRVSEDPRLADLALGPVSILLLASVPWPRFP